MDKLSTRFLLDFGDSPWIIKYMVNIVIRNYINIKNVLRKI